MRAISKLANCEQSNSYRYLEDDYSTIILANPEFILATSRVRNIQYPPLLRGSDYPLYDDDHHITQFLQVARPYISIKGKWSMVSMIFEKAFLTPASSGSEKPQSPQLLASKVTIRPFIQRSCSGVACEDLKLHLQMILVYLTYSEGAYRCDSFTRS
ncbi:hypothetical protein J6590_059408 [Homalodisca vitripennis]|nr:hypothetical protein J6590_059408 [Homalodisca vitripennis]